MSEYIPFEIQVDIIKRLPVKSLLQFRSVSKQWKSLIDSSEFIAGYRFRQTHPQRLLVWYKDPVDLKQKYVSFVDDDAFAQQELAPTVLVLSEHLFRLEVLGSSQGLLCLSGLYEDHMIVLLNPSIRKSVLIPVPGFSVYFEFVVGFGVCPITNDPTIVKIKNVCTEFGTKFSSPVVDVFKLSRGSWRIACSNLPKKSIQMMIFRCKKQLIISFDMTTEEFRAIDLPDSLAYARLSISKLRESLAVLKYFTRNEPGTQSEFEVCDVWIMDNDVLHSFTKLYTINPGYESIRILGFTNSGEPMMVVFGEDYKEPASLVVYEPNSKHIRDIGIHAEYASSLVSSYMETLLLLDQSDCNVSSLVSQMRLQDVALIRD
ncbi:unnamed protein product [Lactuca virosa]|uniref:F-box domain-containing protein n=1 Tax=Lactuca virosa TaxID=75947 RepID=A0AAU9NAX9_9ASTR|nr:unnamed protein product [Lactuca virosa]